MTQFTAASLLAILAAGLPAAALAQSAEDDSDLFPTDERYFRIGDDDTHVTFAPFVQFDAGPIWVDPGEDDFETETALARLYVFAQAGDTSGTFAYDFQNDTLRYAFVSQQVSDRVMVRVGQQDEPFSLQDYSGGRFLPFVSAGQSAALIPGDNLGAMVRYEGGNYSLASGVFGGNANSGLGDNGVAVTGRATWAPIYEQSRITRGGDAASDGVGTQRVEDLLHLGVALSGRFDIDDPVSFAGGGNSSLVPVTLAGAPAIENVDRLWRANLEVSRQIGSLSLQGEFTAARVEASLAQGTATGGYGYVTYFLTGERRGYNRQTGAFGRVIPQNPIDEGGFGAVEIGARVDYLDLTELGPQAGAQWGLTAVANLYLTKRITLSADYSRTKATAGPDDGLRSDAVTFRAQFAY